MKDIILQALFMYADETAPPEGDETPTICGVDDSEEDQIKVRFSDDRKFIISIEEVTE